MSMLHTLSDLALRHLPKRWFLTLRTFYYTSRRRLSPINQLIHGTFDTDSLRKHLEQRLDPNFEILMVHSSVNHMLPYYKGNALELVNMLIDFIPVEKIPWILVWMDWNFYAYKQSLLILSVFFTCHYWQQTNYHSFSGVGLSIFIGFCSWNVWCAIKYGYAVG